MEMIEVKRIETWDGGERHNFKAYVLDTVNDEEIKKAYQHCLISKTTLVIFDTLSEIEENSVVNLRKSAFEKLTPMERQAVGLIN